MQDKIGIIFTRAAKHRTSFMDYYLLHMGGNQEWRRKST
jgi:hypothetical protein